MSASGSRSKEQEEKVCFSCFHGEEWKRPPVDEETLINCPEIAERIEEEYYKEAARRLPLDEMPELVDCISAGGFCFGLADPVSNIILNAISLLGHHDDQAHDEPTRIMRLFSSMSATSSWFDIALRSVYGLRVFMRSYFRCLSVVQSWRYLHLASHDLRLAISLVNCDLITAGSWSQPLPDLLPDGGKIKHALRLAAVEGKHPKPDVLARLMTAQYPSDLLSPVMAKLQTSDQLLTVRDVQQIRDLLARQWPPTTSPPMANIEFWCRPNGDTCTRCDDGTLRLSTYIGGVDYVVQISVAPTTQLNGREERKYIYDPSGHVHPSALRSKVLWRRPAVDENFDYDASPCEYVVSLKMCLLDTIHNLYLRALAMLPTSWSPRLLRSLLVAGHCYGPMDPFRNIIVNTIWYDIAFPLAQEEVELPRGVLDTRLMSRLELRSLNSFVAMFRHMGCKSEHEALKRIQECGICKSDAFPVAAQGTEEPECAAVPFNDVARAAKHPQHAAFGSFLMSLSSLKIKQLREFFSGDFVRWGELVAFIRESVPEQEEGAASCCLSPITSVPISRKKSNFMSKLAFVNIKLREVLQKYCYQHPW